MVHSVVAQESVCNAVTSPPEERLVASVGRGTAVAVSTRPKSKATRNAILCKFPFGEIVKRRNRRTNSVEHATKKVLVVRSTTSGRNWGVAPPHLVSHWGTISSSTETDDPPPPPGQRQISSYRRAFPEAEYRPHTPLGPSWGGAHA